MTQDFIRAVAGLGVFAFLSAVIAAYLKRGTDRQGNLLAQQRLSWEQRVQEQGQKDERRDELREDLKAAREQIKELTARNEELEERHESRIVACRACGYPCQTSSPPGPADRLTPGKGIPDASPATHD